MAAAGDAFLIVGGLLIVLGSIGIVILELGAAPQRRLVSRLRDAFEVLLPPTLVVALLVLVAAAGAAGPG